MASSSFNSESSERFMKFLENYRLKIVPIGSCQCEKSTECDQLSAEINSLKQIHDAKEKELRSTKEALKSAGRKATEKDSEIKRLKSILLKEKNELEDKTQQIVTLKKNFEEEKTNMEKKVEELQKTMENNQETLEGKIGTFSGFLELLAEEVKFSKEDPKTELISSQELQRLLNHVKEILKTWEKDKQGLEHMGKAIQAAVNVNNSGSFLDSFQKTPEKTTSSSPQSSFPSSSSTMTAQSSVGQPIIKKKEHERDMSFPNDFGFRCTCGTIVKRESSLIAHIRKSTEPWKYNCGICKEKFFYEYLLKRHQKASKECAPQKKGNDGDKKGISNPRFSPKSTPNSPRKFLQRNFGSPNHRRHENRQDFRSRYNNQRNNWSTWSQRQGNNRRQNDTNFYKGKRDNNYRRFLIPRHQDIQQRDGNANNNSINTQAMGPDERRDGRNNQNRNIHYSRRHSSERESMQRDNNNAGASSSR